MPQDLHGDPGMNLQGGQERSARPARVVHGDPWHLRFGDTAVEAAGEVAWLDRCAVAGGEDQAGAGPPAVGPVVVGVLVLLAELERGDA
jgi:hypothetical protein